MIYLILAPIDNEKSVVLKTVEPYEDLEKEYKKISKNVVCEARCATPDEELIVNFCNIIEQNYPLFAR